MMKPLIALVAIIGACTVDRSNDEVGLEIAASDTVAVGDVDDRTDVPPEAPAEPPVPEQPIATSEPPLEDTTTVERVVPDTDTAPVRDTKRVAYAGPASFTRPTGYITVYTNFPGHYYFDPQPSFYVLLESCPANQGLRGWWFSSAWGFRYWFSAWCGEGFVLYAPRINTPSLAPGQTQVWRENNLQENERAAWTQIYIEECPREPWRRRPWWFNSGWGHDYWFDVWCGPGWVATLRRPDEGTPVYPIGGGRKQIAATNIAVRASLAVPDQALRQARGVMLSMFGWNQSPLWDFGNRGITGAIMGRYELQTQLPEYASLSPQSYWNCRARGLGAVPGLQTFSGAEENLLLYGGKPPSVPSGACPGQAHGTGYDPYAGREDIFLHEFAHATLTYAPYNVAGVSTTLRTRVQQRYNQVCPCGNKSCCAWPYTNTYAGENIDEYWAESVQSFFNANDENSGVHGPLNTRGELAAWDPVMFNLVAEVYKGEAWYPDDATCAAGFCGWCRAPFCAP